jgi:hypothetical protein
VDAIREIIVTHPMDAPIHMTIAEMREAVTGVLVAGAPGRADASGGGASI